jgi:hypothetical protein
VAVVEYEPPRPANVDECKSCGVPIAFVRVQPKLAWKAIDVEPHAEGTYVLTGDGNTAIWLLDERLEREQFMSRFRSYEMTHDWPNVRYVDHRLTCTPKGVRTFRSSARDVVSGRQLQDRVRELQRSALKRRHPND